jgi:prepilin-type N-terminal cleavage/methylation domain-containing protein
MRRRGPSGFTLLEILVALAIFTFVAAVAMQTTANAGWNAASGRRARELRMLAERKLGEILTFEQHFDDAAAMDGDLGAEYPEYGTRFHGWTWQLEVRDVTVFGISSDDTAQYLFGAPTDEEKAAANAPASGTSGTSGTPGQPGQPAKKGETQQLRELNLKVSTPAEEGAADSVQLVVFAPPVGKKTAGAAPAAGGTGGK